MPGMDVFNSDAFGMQQLTLAFNETPFVPGRLGEMGLFEEAGVRTTSVSIEHKNNTLALVPSTVRGGPPVQNTRALRDIRIVDSVRIAVQDVIYADEVQNVRAFGSESEMQALQSEVNDRIARMSSQHDATLEHHRVGAVAGKVLDSDGTTVLLNMYTLFGVTEPTAIDFDLDNATPASGALRTKCSAVIRQIEDAIGNQPYTGVTALCSSGFFDALIAHSEVRDSFLYSEGFRLRERSARRELFFGGINFEEYRGSVGGVSYIAANEARIFPVGVPGMFITRFSPADYWDTVNTVGLPRYARQFADPTGSDRFRTVETQSNVLNVCTRPLGLLKGTKT